MSVKINTKLDGVLIYKCRGCGREYKKYSVPDLVKSLIAAVNNSAPASEPQLLTIHSCNRLNYGIADLVRGIENS